MPRSDVLSLRGISYSMLFIVFKNKVHPATDKELHDRFDIFHGIISVLFMFKQMNECVYMHMAEPVEHIGINVLSLDSFGIFLSHFQIILLGKADYPVDDIFIA